MSRRPHTVSLRLTALAATATGALAATAALPLASSAEPSVSQLQGELSQQRAKQHGLSASVSGLSRSLGVLDSQITLVASREAALLSDLQRDRTSLTRIEAQLESEHDRVAALQRRLARARKLLARQVVSRYESDHPDLVGVVIDARGFTDLLERLDFLHRAEVQQQNIIKRTQTAKAQADSAERHLVTLEASDSQVTASASVRERGLAAMNSLLEEKQAELGRARAAQQAALQASWAKGRQLQSALVRATAEQASRHAAASAAAARKAVASAATAGEAPASASPPTDLAPPANAGGSGTSTGSSVAAGSALLPSDGWAIPYSVVLCESGGVNLPPNEAGASGYYQIVTSTWKQYGGHGAAAYLASKPEQDAVASRIWARGAGAPNWVCASVIGKG